MERKERRERARMIKRKRPKPDDQLTVIVLRLEEQMNRIQEEKWRKAEPVVWPPPSAPRWFTFTWDDGISTGTLAEKEAGSP